MKPGLPSITEAEFMRQVLELAKLRGWRSAHFRPGRVLDKDGTPGWRTAVSGDGNGWPDLVLAKGPRLVFIELKTDQGKPTAEQLHWLCVLREAGQDARVWHPSQWAEIEATLE